MKRMLLVLLLGLPGAVSAETYSILGHWEGAVARLGSVQPVQVDFREQDGKLAATVDIPERGLVAMPAETVEYTPPTLRLKFLYGDATLRVDAETEEMTGVIPAGSPRCGSTSSGPRPRRPISERRRSGFPAVRFH